MIDEIKLGSNEPLSEAEELDIMRLVREMQSITISEKNSVIEIKVPPHFFTAPESGTYQIEFSSGKPCL